MTVKSKVFTLSDGVFWDGVGIMIENQGGICMRFIKKLRGIAVRGAASVTAMAVAFGAGICVYAGEPEASAGYKIVAEASEGAEIVLDVENADPGETVVFSVVTEGDFIVRGVEVVGTDGEQIDFKVTGEFRYGFTMPDSDASVRVFAEDYGIVTRGECAERLWELAGKPEVSEPDIQIICSKAEEPETADESCKPEAPDRADCVRGTDEEKAASADEARCEPDEASAKESGPVDDKECGADIPVSPEAAVWAVRNGILSAEESVDEVGAMYKDGVFDAGRPLSREELCKALYRLAGMIGADTENGAVDLETTDCKLISESVYPAVRWAVGNGIVSEENGAVGYFRPLEKIVRCDFVRSLEGFSELTGLGAKKVPAKAPADAEPSADSTDDIEDMKDIEAGCVFEENDVG